MLERNLLRLYHNFADSQGRAVLLGSAAATEHVLPGGPQPLAMAVKAAETAAAAATAAQTEVRELKGEFVAYQRRMEDKLSELVAALKPPPS